MRDKTKKRIGFIVASSFIVFFILILIWTGHERGYERTINVEKDSYVYEYYPDNNYGVDDYLRVGNYSFGEVQAYYHFNISSLPYGWTEVNLLVNFDYGSNMVDIGANLTYESWDEMTITWNNKPNNSVYRGHILCDGFDFRIPVRSDQIVNDGVSVCLYGRGEEINGFIQGNSKEGASSRNDIAKVELSYKGIDPNILNDLRIAGIVICIVIAVIGMITVIFIVIIKPKLIKISKNRRKLMEKNVFDAEWINTTFGKTTWTTRLEKKINDFITLKMVGNRTFIFVNGQRFIQCIRLILNIPKNDVDLYEEVDSIDEAAKLYNKHVFQNRIVTGPMAAPVPNQSHTITPKQEFWGHCSNIQAWVEHDYDTRILMTNISFPLLRELTKAGDPLAKKVFKEEIALRLESGFPSVVQYLINQGYLSNFTLSEFKVILETTNIIKNLLSKSNDLYRFLMSCISRFPNFLRDILFEILKQPNGKTKFISILSQSTNRFNLRFFTRIKRALNDLLTQTESDMHECIIECLNTIESNIGVQSHRVPAESGRTRLELIKKMLLQKEIGAPLEQINDPNMEKRLKVLNDIFDKPRGVQLKCRYCGKNIRRGSDTCDWCGHQWDDDNEDFFPYPYIFKPPGGGGGMLKEGALVIHVRG